MSTFSELMAKMDNGGRRAEKKDNLPFNARRIPPVDRRKRNARRNLMTRRQAPIHSGHPHLKGQLIYLYSKKPTICAIDRRKNYRGALFAASLAK